MRPLPAPFDLELSDDEALRLFRDRKAMGTADEAMFVCQREVLRHITEQNGSFSRLATAVYKHFEGHPVSESVQSHLDDAHDAAVTTRFIRRAGGWGTASLALLISVFGGAMTVLQIIALTR